MKPTSATCFVTAALAAIVSIGPLGCAGSDTVVQTMTTSARVPAGAATIRTSKTSNGNTALSLQVRDLAPPSRVAENATVYMVWIQPPKGTIQGVGALILGPDLSGTLSTETPYDEFKVSVTPEPNSQVQQPTHAPVLSSEVDRRP
jgi:hypothetical protein